MATCDSPGAQPAPPPIPPLDGINITSLYRAHVTADRRGTEVTAFVEASSAHVAAKKIAAVIAALEYRHVDDVIDRIYNVYSAEELIAENVSEDPVLRVFETGWSQATGDVLGHLFTGERRQQLERPIDRRITLRKLQGHAPTSRQAYSGFERLTTQPPPECPTHARCCRVIDLGQQRNGPLEVGNDGGGGGHAVTATGCCIP